MLLPNVVLFQGTYTPGTQGLWETNGAASGTVLLWNGPLPNGYGFEPNDSTFLDLTVFNDQALFIGRDVNGFYNLWTTSGTGTGTAAATELTVPVANEPNPTGLFTAKVSGGVYIPVSPDLTVFGSEVLFDGVDKAGNLGLWTTNGTAAGTAEVTGIVGAASTGVNPSDITIFNGEALFNGADTAGDLGLWTTNGTGAGTEELTDIAGAATTGLDPKDMVVYDGEVLFNGTDASGNGLWVTNGTATGTQELMPGIDPTDMVVYG